MKSDFYFFFNSPFSPQKEMDLSISMEVNTNISKVL